MSNRSSMYTFSTGHILAFLSRGMLDSTSVSYILRGHLKQENHTQVHSRAEKCRKCSTQDTTKMTRLLVCCRRWIRRWCWTSPSPAEGHVKGIKVSGSLCICPSGQKGSTMIGLDLVEWANLLRQRSPMIKSTVCIFNSVNHRKWKLMVRVPAHELPFVLWGSTVIVLGILTCSVIPSIFNIAFSWSHLIQLPSDSLYYWEWPWFSGLG